MTGVLLIVLLSAWFIVNCHALTRPPSPRPSLKLAGSAIDHLHRKTIASILCSAAMLNPILPVSAAPSALETSVVSLEKAETRGDALWCLKQCYLRHSRYITSTR